MWGRGGGMVLFVSHLGFYHLKMGFGIGTNMVT